MITPEFLSDCALSEGARICVVFWRVGSFDDGLLPDSVGVEKVLSGLTKTLLSTLSCLVVIGAFGLVSFSLRLSVT